MFKNSKKTILNAGRALGILAKCTVCIAVGSYTTQAQSNAPSQEKSWEMAVDLLPLVGKGQDSYGFFVRRIVSNEKAYRFRLSPRADGLIVNNLVSLWSINAGVGIERRKILEEKMVFYYGADLSAYYESRPKPAAFTRNSSLSVRMSPFVALQYYLHKRISVGLESHLTFGYESHWLTPGEDLYGEMELRFTPLQCFYVSYKL